MVYLNDVLYYLYLSPFPSSATYDVLLSADGKLNIKEIFQIDPPVRTEVDILMVFKMTGVHYQS